MKKIAVIGDSHTAMLKLAWDEIQSENASIDVSFFVWRSDGKKELILRGENSEIAIQELKILENLNNVVELSEYDVILICGLGFGIQSILNIYKHHRTQNQKRGTYLISESCFNAAVQGTVKQSLAMKVADIVASHSDVLQCLIPSPRGSEYLLDESEKFNSYKLCIQNGDEESISETFIHSAHLFEEKNVKVLHQPSNTIRNSIFTEKKYNNAFNSSENDKYLEIKGRRDLIHMNVLYGKQFFLDFYQYI
jgi:hypothetical protein